MRYFILFTLSFCIYINEANASDLLGFSKNYSAFIEVKALDFNFMAFTNSITLDDINDHFTKDSDGYLDDNDKSYLLDKFSGNSSLNTYIEATPLSVKVNYKDYNFFISTKDIAYFNFDIPQDAPALILKGNEKNKNYNFNDMAFRSSYFRKYAIGISKKIHNSIINTIIPDSSLLGINIGYIRGFSYVDANIGSSRLYTDDIGKISGNLEINALTSFSPDFGVNHEYANTEYASEPGFFNNPAGQGYSFDLYWQSKYVDTSWNYKIGIYNLGSILWNKNTGEYTSKSEFYFSDIFNESQLDSLEDAFDFESKEREFTTSTPANMKIELSTYLNQYIDLPFFSTAYFSYYQALNDEHYNSYAPKISFILNNHFSEYLPNIGFGVKNNMFNQLEMPIFISYNSIYFQGLIGIRDVSSYLNSSTDLLSFYSKFTFFIY